MNDQMRLFFRLAAKKGFLVLAAGFLVAPAFGQETGSLVGITNAHNVVRQAVSCGTPPRPGAVVQPQAFPALPDLVWNNQIAATAQAWADNCVFDHDPNTPYGENLSAGAPSQTGIVASNNWADEVIDYDYAQNQSTGGAIGHYTQQIWASTTEIGCGTKSCPNILGGADFIVCRYNPPGNFPTRPYCTATQTNDCVMGPGNPSACGGGGNQTLTVTKNGTGTGTVTSAPPGIACGADCTEDYADQTAVNLTANADAGSVFVTWGGACAGAGANPICPVTMDMAKTATAQFDTQAGCQDDGFEANGSGGTDDTCSGTDLGAIPATQTHLHCDEDWVYFNANAGTQYRIETINLIGGSDTTLELHNDNCAGGQPIETNDDRADGDFSSEILWTAPAAINVDVRIQQYQGQYGPGKGYDIRVTEVGACAAPDGQDVVLSNDTVNDTRTVHVCGTITTGDAYAVGATGNLTLRGPTAVIFGNGFSALQGSQVTVRND